MSEQTNGVWRPVYIDGATLVCINGTGDLPLSMYVIDPAKCSFEQLGGPVATPPGHPVVGVPAPPDNLPPVAAVPEPSTYAILLVGLIYLTRLFHVRRKA